MTTFIEVLAPLILIIKFIFMLLPVMLGFAFLTLIERKVMGSAHRRHGPNVVGFLGILQAVADGVKLMLKETIFPNSTEKLLFISAPILTFFLMLASWIAVPFSEESVLADIDTGILYLFCISTLGVYAILLAGWSSHSRYALIGGLRAAAQMVSYEVSMGLILMGVVICTGSLNLLEIISFQENIWLLVPLFPNFILFFISAVAETNRPPFDLPEAEAELVSGYNVEYGGIGFALFFMGEYGNCLLMSLLTVVFFLGGWSVPSFLIYLAPGYVWYAVKLSVIIFFFIWVRIAFPRFRYDQLMRLGWKVFLPFSLLWFVFLASITFKFGLLAL